MWLFVGRMQYAPTRVSEKMAFFLFVRPPVWPFVRRMQYAPTLPAENLSGFRFFYPRNEIIVIFWDTRVGAYCIRPTNGHANSQMNGKLDRVLVRFYPINQKSDRNWIHPASGVAVCRAYAIRPYPTGGKFIVVSVRFYPMNQKSDRNWIHSASGVVVCGAYAVAPYTIDLKNGDFSVYSTTGVVVCGTYAIRPYPTGQKFIGVLVRFYPMNQKFDPN